MKPRSQKLEVVARLARIDERRAIAKLGKVVQRVGALERDVEDARLAAAATLGCDAPAGTALDLATLRAHDAHRDALAARRARSEGALGAARAALRVERDGVVRARRRLNAIENAIAKRRAQERLERARAEARRLDDLVGAAQEVRDA